MINLKRILLPTDFSENSQVAVAYACALADQFGSELHLLNVMEDMLTMIPEPGMAFPPPGDFMLELKAGAEKSLTQIPDAAWARGKTVVRATRQGAPFLEIIRYAKEKDIDLIVLSTHGRGGLAHVLMGSVAERVVRKSPCPVLTVRPSTHQFVMP